MHTHTRYVEHARYTQGTQVRALSHTIQYASKLQSAVSSFKAYFGQNRSMH